MSSARATGKLTLESTKMVLIRVIAKRSEIKKRWQQLLFILVFYPEWLRYLPSALSRQSQVSVKPRQDHSADIRVLRLGISDYLRIC